jgi:uncharacterized membrane-anchored protein YitT (DUF2179 family)
MSSPVKRISPLVIFFGAVFFRFLIDLLFLPQQSFPAESQTLLPAVFGGIFLGASYVFLLWVYYKYNPKYLFEIFLAALGFLIASRASDVFFRDMMLWYGFATGLVSIVIMTYAYQRLARKIRDKNSSEETE